jgi:hypothetical protein
MGWIGRRDFIIDSVFASVFVRGRMCVKLKVGAAGVCRNIFCTPHTSLFNSMYQWRYLCKPDWKAPGNSGCASMNGQYLDHLATSSPQHDQHHI